MARNQKTSMSNFYCTKCGKQGLPVHRKRGQLREGGHLKKLYCIYCGVEVNHAEVREIGGYSYEDFMEEFNSGRFKEDGTRDSKSELITCSNTNCICNKSGKCWNSNDSLNCKHKPKEVMNNENI